MTDCNEADLLAEYKAAARQRLAASLGQANENARDGAGQIGTLVRRHPFLAMGASFAAGFIAVLIGRRVVRAIAARNAQPTTDPAAAAVRPRHSWFHRIVVDVLVPIATQRLMAMVARPHAEVPGSPPPSSPSPTDSI